MIYRFVFYKYPTILLGLKLKLKMFNLLLSRPYRKRHQTVNESVDTRREPYFSDLWLTNVGNPASANIFLPLYNNTLRSITYNSNKTQLKVKVVNREKI